MSNLDKMKNKLLIYNVVIVSLYILAVLFACACFIIGISFELRITFVILFVIMCIALRIVRPIRNDLKKQIKVVNVVKGAIEDTTESKIKNNNDNKYEKKTLMTDCEMYFYNILQENFANDYLIMPQVNLATIINKHKEFEKQYHTELFRNIDFGIFDKDNTNILLLIEINDKTHNNSDRISRDKKVKDICDNANINLITFYTKYDNNESYVVDRIKKELLKNI